MAVQLLGQPNAHLLCRLLAFGFCPAGSSGGDDKAEPQQSFMKSLLKADKKVPCLRLQHFLRFLCTSPSSPLLLRELEKETGDQPASAMNILLFECELSARTLAAHGTGLHCLIP